MWEEEILRPSQDTENQKKMPMNKEYKGVSLIQRNLYIYTP